MNRNNQYNLFLALNPIKWASILSFFNQKLNNLKLGFLGNLLITTSEIIPSLTNNYSVKIQWQSTFHGRFNFFFFLKLWLFKGLPPVCIEEKIQNIKGDKVINCTRHWTFFFLNFYTHLRTYALSNLVNLERLSF